MTSFAKRIRVVVLAFLAAAAVLTPYNAWKDIQALRARAAVSQPITGTITGRNMRPAHYVDLYFLHYVYTVGGHRYTDTERVSESDYGLVADGSPIPLMYTPANPTFHYLNPITDQTILDAISDWIVRALIVIGFFALFAAGNEVSLRKQVRLLRDGTTARAAVTEMLATRGNWGPSASAVSYRITCRFWTGQEEIAKQFVVPASLYGSVSVGGPVTIIFDRQHPNNSAPYQAISDVFLDACPQTR